jgi:hypothetical protein
MFENASPFTTLELWVGDTTGNNLEIFYIFARLWRYEQASPLHIHSCSVLQPIPTATVTVKQVGIVHQCKVETNCGGHAACACIIASVHTGPGSLAARRFPLAIIAMPLLDHRGPRRAHWMVLEWACHINPEATSVLHGLWKGCTAWCQ